MVWMLDNHGDLVSTFTDEMLEDLRDAVLNKSPRDFGYLS